MNSFFGKSGKVLLLVFTLIFTLVTIGVQKSYANELLRTKPNMNSIIELQKSLEFTEESLAVDIDKAKIETEIKINEDEAIKIESDNKFKPQSQYGVGGLILNTRIP